MSGVNDFFQEVSNPIKLDKAANDLADVLRKSIDFNDMRALFSASTDLNVQGLQPLIIDGLEELSERIGPVTGSMLNRGLDNSLHKFNSTT